MLRKLFSYGLIAALCGVLLLAGIGGLLGLIKGYEASSAPLAVSAFGFQAAITGFFMGGLLGLLVQLNKKMQSAFSAVLLRLYIGQIILTFVVFAWTMIRPNDSALFGFPFPVFSYILFALGNLAGQPELEFHLLNLIYDVLALCVSALAVSAFIRLRKHVSPK